MAPLPMRIPPFQFACGELVHEGQGVEAGKNSPDPPLVQGEEGVVVNIVVSGDTHKVALAPGVGDKLPEQNIVVVDIVVAAARDSLGRNHRDLGAGYRRPYREGNSYLYRLQTP